jgi:hypothetical protein
MLMAHAFCGEGGWMLRREGAHGAPSLRRTFPSPVRAMSVARHEFTDGGGAGVGVAVKRVRAKCAVTSIRNLFFLVSLRAAEGGEAISALMRRTGTRRSRRPFWPPRRDTATCWPNLFMEVVVHALSVRCTKVRLVCQEMASTEENVVSQGQPNSGEFSDGFYPTLTSG